VLIYIKCSNVTKTKCPIAMYKVLKSEIFGNFGPLIEHGPPLLKNIWLNHYANHSFCGGTSIVGFH
jgi:hypothetical protein